MCRPVTHVFLLCKTMVEKEIVRKFAEFPPLVLSILQLNLRINHICITFLMGFRLYCFQYDSTISYSYQQRYFISCFLWMEIIVFTISGSGSISSFIHHAVFVKPKRVQRTKWHNQTTQSIMMMA